MGNVLATPFPTVQPRPRQRLDPQAKRLLHIAQNLKDLASRNASLRDAARQRLSEWPPTTDDLIPLLDDPDTLVRRGAASWLRDVGKAAGDAATDALLGALDDRSDLVVEAAIGSLGILRATAAGEQLIDLLSDRNPRIVHAAIFALGRIGPTEVGTHLVPFLRSPTDHLCFVALAAVRELGYGPAAPTILEQLKRNAGRELRSGPALDRPTKYIQTLAALNAREAVPLLTRLAQETVGLRGKAIRALTALRADAAAPELTDFLARLIAGPPEPRLCFELLGLMRAVTHRPALPVIRRCLQYPDRGVRQLALRIVTDWRDEESVRQVREMCYQDESAFIRPEAVASLVTLAGREAIADLMALAQDANALVRRAVMQGLGAIPDLPLDAAAVLDRLRRAVAGGEAIPSHPVPPTGHLDGAGQDESFMSPDLQGQVEAMKAFRCRW